MYRERTELLWKLGMGLAELVVAWGEALGGAVVSDPDNPTLPKGTKYY